MSRMCKHEDFTFVWRRSLDASCVIVSTCRQICILFIEQRSRSFIWSRHPLENGSYRYVQSSKVFVTSSCARVMWWSRQVKIEAVLLRSGSPTTPLHAAGFKHLKSTQICSLVNPVYTNESTARVHVLSSGSDLATILLPAVHVFARSPFYLHARLSKF